MDCIDRIYENDDIVDVLGTYSYHSYWTNDFLLKRAYGDYIRKNYKDVELEMSEWCELPCEHNIDDIEAGLIMARTIGEDIADTGVNSWSTWVAVNEGGERADSMIAVGDSYENYQISKRYYAMGHYTKFIPVGSHAIDFNVSVGDVTATEFDEWPYWLNDEPRQNYKVENYLTVSAYKTPDKKYVVVIVNEGDDKEISFNMLGWDAEVYTTDDERNLELTSQTKGHKKITVGAKSITTVVFER
jgi:hypothetical protein